MTDRSQEGELLCIFLAFVALFVRAKSSSGLFLGTAIFLLVIGLYGGSIVDALMPYTEDSAFESKFSNFSSLLNEGNIETEEGSIQGRTALTALTLKVFLNSPVFGNPQGYIGGHNYFIDRFALYGTVGVIPFFLMLYYCYNMVVNYLPQEKRNIYKLLFIGFIVLGLLKNISGLDYWLFVFCLYPFILKYSNHFN